MGLEGSLTFASEVLIPCTQRHRLPPLEQGREPHKERKKEERKVKAQRHLSFKVPQSTLSAVLKHGALGQLPPCSTKSGGK